jgi:UDP-2,4-diacetamido-2,4,6-trideoxy-beta-L-altropyranose hydrolase
LRIAVRADASDQIGIGHIMRCLTLAQALSRYGQAEVIFVCNQDIPDAVGDRIGQEGFRLIKTPWNAVLFDWSRDVEFFTAFIRECKVDWIIVDHYGVDRQWETAVRPYTKKIAVIDDLANRLHDCDVLLDQNLSREMNRRYHQLVPPSCTLFLGPSHVILREEFYQLRDKVKPKNHVRNVLVNFGGSDPTNEICKVLHAIRDQSLFPGWQFHIVAGPANENQKEIQMHCEQLSNATYYPSIDAKRLPAFMLDMDLAIGAGGISLWERCFMAIPSLVISIADNQVEAATEAQRRGIIWYLGQSVDVTSDNIVNVLHKLFQNRTEISHKSRLAYRMMESARSAGLPSLASYILQYSG